MPWVCDGDISKSWKSLYCLAVLATGLVPRQGLITKPVTKPVGFRSLPFSFLADRDSRNRTFAHHVGLPLAEGLEMISRYLRRHPLCRITLITSKHPCFITRSSRTPPWNTLQHMQRVLRVHLLCLNTRFFRLNIPYPH